MGWRMLGQPWGILGGALGTRLGGGKAATAAPLVYLLKDLFTTDEAAPLTSPRTCEPGPGTLVAVDTGNNFDIAGGQLVSSGRAAISDPGIWDNDGQARAAGLAFFSSITFPSTTINGVIGFDNDKTGAIDRTAIATNTAGVFFGKDNGGNIGAFYSYAAATYQLGIILRTAGGFFLVKPSAGNWTLLWVSVADTTATIYAGWGINDTETQQVDYFKIAQLPSPWNDDYGIATQRLAGARSAGDTFTHTADCLVEMEVATIPAALQIELWFRKQDNSNYWAVTVDSGGTMDLDEVVGGGTTQRGTSAGTVANSDRVVAIADDETITVFEDDNLRITYALAANFKTETSGELDTEGTGGAVTDIISWPRYPSETVLNSYADG